MASPSQIPDKKPLANAFFIKVKGYFGNGYPIVNLLISSAQPSVQINAEWPKFC